MSSERPQSGRALVDEAIRKRAIFYKKKNSARLNLVGIGILQETESVVMGTSGSIAGRRSLS